MNERIKELAEQAGMGPMGIAFSSEIMTKFAELIVQDIINTLLYKARWYQVLKDDNAVMALCDLVEFFREEYGVE
jgi:hypothetical protein